MKDKECKTYIHTYKCNEKDCKECPNRLRELKYAIDILMQNNVTPKMYESVWKVFIAKKDK